MMYNIIKEVKQLIRKQMYIDNYQDEQIQSIAKNLGTTQAEILRRAITYYLVNHNKRGRTIVKENDK